MKTKIAAVLMAITPSLVMAHEGHGGVGLFHHMYEVVPAIVLVAIVAFIFYKKSK
ncbi:hypothetical protein [Shewanella japonica]|uniref:hypothetical protein n=1 Tax=Shewanella japonica TaxID=93973 RepID=UPI0013C4F383|nr:hypothetical protein [Shewanella japonica]